MKRIRSNSLLLLPGLVMLLCLGFGPRLAWAAPSAESGVLLAASDGKGEIRLLWAPPAGFWPAGGWRVQDQDGKALADVKPLAEPFSYKPILIKEPVTRLAAQQLP